jgi:hypothetical protein
VAEPRVAELSPDEVRVRIDAWSGNAQQQVQKLQRALSKIAEELTAEQMQLYQARLTLQALEVAVKASPVGNPSLWVKPRKGYVGGTYRSNWQASVRRDSNVLPNEKGRPGQPPSSRQIQQASASLAQLQPYSVSYVFNNVPYAQRIEIGHSSQAPAGVTAQVINNLRQQVLSERQEMRRG